MSIPQFLIFAAFVIFLCISITRIYKAVRDTAIDKQSKLDAKEKELTQTLKTLISKLERNIDTMDFVYRKFIDLNPSGGFVYIIQDIDVTRYYKIGRSHEIKRRLGRFDTKLPMRVRVVGLLYAGSKEIEFEAHLHRQYASQRIRGEWFALSFSDVLEIQRKWLDNEYKEIIG